MNSRLNNHYSSKGDIMKILQIILRKLLGLMLLAFGLNKFLWFMPAMEFGDDVAAKDFFEALTETTYMWPLVGITEIFVGLLLVIKKWVPLALVVLVPVSVNLVLFHLVLNLPSIGPAVLVAILNVFLLYKYWGAYRSLFN